MKKLLMIGSISILCMTLQVWAAQGLPSTEEQIASLKADVLEGNLKIGKTRLHEFVRMYGESSTVSSTEKAVIVEYPSLKIEFEKTRYWKNWQYDSSRSQVYTKDVDKLRKDLESQKLVGDNITFAKVRKDYGEPTASLESTDDGNLSIYFYGNIKMVFENRITLKRYEGKNLVAVSTGAVALPAKSETKIKDREPVAPKSAKTAEIPKDIVASQKIETAENPAK